ncbi:hypothetical protein HN51_050524 [Arachis hypogaea]
MLFLNYTNIPVVVTESGWPSKGGSNKPDATIDTANTYNSNLIKHVLNQTATPKCPGIAASTCIYELYNEDMKPGPLSEKNWGLFNANGEPKKGKTPDSCHFDGDKDAGDYAFVLSSDASIPCIIMKDKNVVQDRLNGKNIWIRWWTRTQVRYGNFEGRIP